MREHENLPENLQNFSCLTTLAAAPRDLGAKIALHIQQQPLKWLKKDFYFCLSLHLSVTETLWQA